MEMFQFFWNKLQRVKSGLTLALPALDLSSEHIKYRKLSVGRSRRSTDFKVSKGVFHRCTSLTFPEQFLLCSPAKHILKVKKAFVLCCWVSIGHGSYYVACLLRVSHGRW